MPTPILSPVAGMHDALATYLASKVVGSAVAGSVVEKRWPEPTEDLQISEAAPHIRLGIVRVGAARYGDRIGNPVLSRLDITSSPNATARFDLDEVEQDFVLGLWAATDRQRDEADEIVSGWLTQPFWTTIAPLVNTTLASPVAKAGTQVVTLTSTRDVWYRTKLQIGAGASLEVVEVEDLGITRGQLTITATFTKTHSAGEAVVEVKGRRDYAALGANCVYLRVPDHFNAVALFEFDEPSNLDEERGQRQEWTSLRQGRGRMRHITELPAIVQATLGGTVTTETAAGATGTTRTLAFK